MLTPIYFLFLKFKFKTVVHNFTDIYNYSVITTVSFVSIE